MFGRLALSKKPGPTFLSRLRFLIYSGSGYLWRRFSCASLVFRVDNCVRWRFSRPPVFPSFSRSLFAVFVVNAATEGDSDELISDDLLESHSRDLDYIKFLTDDTLTCSSCKKRHVIDQQVEGTEYCECDQRKASVYGAKSDGVAWSPFLERKDIIVWRQEHPDLKGLYAYKMYGRFDDVSANEFLEVQLDMSQFRQSWDISTAQCHIIEDNTEEGESSVRDVRNTNHFYYWEVNWPRMFSNRDYVCNRRSKVFYKASDGDTNGNYVGCCDSSDNSRDSSDNSRDRSNDSRDSMDNSHDSSDGSRDSMDNSRDSSNGSRNSSNNSRDSSDGSRDLNNSRDSSKDSRDSSNNSRDSSDGSRDSSNSSRDNVIVCYTKSTTHPNCPKKAKDYRVDDYWSVLTIKPFESFDKPGIEFSLTAFENPGLSLPSYITTWVAMRAMPDYMANLRRACLEKRTWVNKPGKNNSVNVKEPTYIETPRSYHADKAYS